MNRCLFCEQETNHSPDPPYAKDVKTFNEPSNPNNGTADSIGSIDKKPINAINQNENQLSSNSDEKPVKNINDVFRDVDERKIQSNTKDIEEDSDNILQSKRNVSIAKSTSTQSTPFEMESTTGAPITATTTLMTSSTPTSTPSPAPVTKPINNLSVDDTAENLQKELLARRRRRRRHHLRK